jgi:mono/diheme cytochrome c family protein
MIQIGAFAIALIFGGSFWLESIRAKNTSLAVEGGPVLEEPDAKALYDNNCAKCHGKDGRAKTFRGKLTGAQNLTDATWQEEIKDEDINDAITNGRGSMPSYKKKLSEEDVKALVGYIRNLKK